MKHQLILIFLSILLNTVVNYAQTNYTGNPGKIQCEFYDVSGEGVAYHDIDYTNNGSGRLNPANELFSTNSV